MEKSSALHMFFFFLQMCLCVMCVHVKKTTTKPTRGDAFPEIAHGNSSKHVTARNAHVKENEKMNEHCEKYHN